MIINGNDCFSQTSDSTEIKVKTDSTTDSSRSVFELLSLGKQGLSRRAFDYAMLGHKYLKSKGRLSNDDILTIVDFTLPSDKKRLFVINLSKPKLLYVTHVAHGKNTGVRKAMYFSNEPESFKSSVGFYTTKGTYNGAHGYSMRMEGHEKGFNDNANKRDIVVHSADYVDESLINAQGFIGRSLGCPALSPEMYKQVINKIKNGTCFFVYGNDSKYITESKMLKQKIKSNQ